MTQPNNIPANIAVPGGAPNDQQSTSTYLTQLGTKLNNWVAQAANATNYLLTATSSENEGANVVDYGADPTGVSDCTTAFQSAMAASSFIVIPPGTYQFKSTLAVTIAAGKALTFRGAGSEVTFLRFAQGDGFGVTFGSQISSLRVEGMTFLAGGQGIGNGIRVVQTQITGPAQPISLFSDLTFRGSDGFGASNYWTYGIQIVGASWFNYFNCNFIGDSGRHGNGISASGNSVAVSVVHNLIGCNFYTLDSGFVYNSYVQGVTASSSNFTGCNYGFFVAASGVNLDQLVISLCQFYCYTCAINSASPIADLIISNNLFIAPSNAICIQIDNTSNYTIIGNCIEQNGTTNNGIVIKLYNSRGGLITGNFVSGMTTGIWLQSNSQVVNVQSNQYSSNTTNVLNQGTGNTVGGGSA